MPSEFDCTEWFFCGLLRPRVHKL